MTTTDPSSTAFPEETSMTRTLRVAAAQFEMRAVDSFDAFAEQVRALLDRAGDARLVVLPELFTEALFTLDPDWQQHRIDQLTRIADHTEAYRDLFRAEAAGRDQWILAGSHLVATERGHENVAFLFGPDGQEHRHSKTHIFPAEAEWGTAEGDELAVFDVDGVSVGIAICYEAEIPEVSTTLTAMGAEVLLVPSYTFTEAGFWRVRDGVPPLPQLPEFPARTRCTSCTARPSPTSSRRSLLAGPVPRCSHPATWSSPPTGCWWRPAPTSRTSWSTSSTSTCCTRTAAPAPRPPTRTAVAARTCTPSTTTSRSDPAPRPRKDS